MKVVLHIVISLILAMHSGFNILAAQHHKVVVPEFKASAPGVVTVGRPFNYTITGNINVQVNVSFPDIEGVRITGGPSRFVSTRSTFSNGQMETITELSLTYNMVADREGEITIPPVSVRAGNNTYTTNPVKISVVRDQQAPASSPVPDQAPQAQTQTGTDNYFVRLIPSKRSVFLGEQFTIDAKIFTSERLRFSEVNLPEYEGFWKHELDADQQAGRDVIEGREFLTQVFKRDLLLPQKPGNIRISPAEITVMVQRRVRSQRRSPFGDIFSDPFFDSYENVPVSLRSNALSIEVKPLPPDAPAGFDGAVGKFTVDLAADRTETRVNDAITLRLTLRGNGNLSLINAPKLALPPDVESFSPRTNRNITHSPGGTAGTVSFEYVIIPRYAGKFRIPPVDFAFFDPATQKYQTLRTSEINVNVEAAPDEDKSSVTARHNLPPGIIRERVNNLGTDILFIKTNKPAFQRINQDISKTIIFKLAFPAGIFAYILLVVLYRKKVRQNNDIAYTRNKQARKKAVKRLKAARRFLGTGDKQMCEEILKAFWDYLSDKLNVPRADLSRASIENGLKRYNLPDELMAQLWEVIDECEMTGYATVSAGEPDLIYSRAEELLFKLEQTLK